MPAKLWPLSPSIAALQPRLEPDLKMMRCCTPRFLIGVDCSGKEPAGKGGRFDVMEDVIAV